MVINDIEYEHSLINFFLGFHIDTPKRIGYFENIEQQSRSSVEEIKSTGRGCLATASLRNSAQDKSNAQNQYFLGGIVGCHFPDGSSR
jgi:hypothetical protein